MPIDPYSPCPGGLDKKVKFCCHDLVGELDKIDRMRQAEQRTACLDHVEKLDAKYPGRPCLMTAKADLLRELGRTDEADSTVQSLLGQNADNPVALAEAAILACQSETEDAPRQAVGLLQHAIAASGERISSKLVEALARVAETLLATGNMLAARAHLHLYLALNQQDKGAMELLMRLDRTPTVSLLVKEARNPVVDVPEGAPWRSAFAAAMEPLSHGQWSEVANRLTALVQRSPDAAPAWRNLAILRGWLLDDSAAEAWRKYAALALPLDDAVEAEALAQLLDPNPPDQIEMVAVKYQVHDLERLTEVLLSNRNCIVMPAPPLSDDPESPPPKSVFVLFDRPMPEEGTPIELSTLPRLLAQLFIYGRQTDREARLEVIGDRTPLLEQAKAAMAEISFGLLGPAEEEVLAALPWSESMLRGHWQPPPHATSEDLERLRDEHQRDVLLNQWPKTPLELLASQTPEQAARQPGQHKTLLAAILNLQLDAESQLIEIDFNQLRSRLGLPIAEPIEASGEALGALPLVRLSRVPVARLSDEDLMQMFVRAASHAAIAAWRNSLGEIATRPAFAALDDKAEVFGMLANLSGSSGQALTRLEEARQAATATNQSTARWDLQEINLRIRRREPEHISRLIEHVAQEHVREPGVREALFNIMVQLGMVRPDGTPAQPAEDAAGLVTPAAEAGKIWTPDSERGEKKSGLWLPGS